MTRPFDRHLDHDELDALVSSHAASVTDSGQLPEQALGEAQRHVESCQDCSRKVQMHKSVQSEMLRLGAPSNAPPGRDCVADLEWIDVAAGLLPEARTRELVKHAAQCGHCGPLLKNAAETLADGVTPGEETLLASVSSSRPEWHRTMAATLRGKVRERQRKTPWLRAVFHWPRPAVVFAGIAAVAIVSWTALRTFRPPTAEQLLARAYSDHRTLEVRIPGAKYAPMRVERAANGSSLDKSPSLLKAEALISENLRKNPNDPAWLQAKARADMLDGNYEPAIKSLQRALETQPDSPSLLTDLGSAYFVRAEAADRAIDYGNAIESLSKALAKLPDDPVALFNRALACERMFLYTQAVDDWEHYLRVDRQGDWAEDARKHLAAVKQNVEQHEKSQNEPLLTPSEIARAGSDDAAVREKIDERIEEYLQIAVAEWLPKAYPSIAQGSLDSGEFRAALRVLAEITGKKHGDRWLGDLLLSSSSPRFAAAAMDLSHALKANDNGDNEVAKERSAHGERLFDLSGSIAGSRRARLEYVFALHLSQDGDLCLQAARARDTVDESRSYAWLETEFSIERGTCYWLKGNLGQGRAEYERALMAADSARYNGLVLRAENHLSGIIGAAGNLPGSWARARRGLARFWSCRCLLMQGYNLYYDLYEFSRMDEQPHLQMALWRDGLSLSKSFGDPVLKAMAHSAMGDAAAAANSTDVAESEFAIASQLFAASPPTSFTRVARIEAETRLAQVETKHAQAQKATARLLQLEPEVSKLSDAFLAILFYASLGDAQYRLGDLVAAEPSLRSAISLAESHLRSLSDDKSRIEWNQRVSIAYREYTELKLRQGKDQEALELWELYRGAMPRSLDSGKSVRLAGAQPPTEPSEVTTRLPSLTTETVVSYALLPQGLAVWVYDNRGVFVHWKDGDPTDIAAKAARFRRLCSDPASDGSILKQDARALYDLLIAPVEEQLSPGRVLAIELDDLLSGLPLEALIDRQGRYLSEHEPIVLSLGIYYRRDARALVPVTEDSAALVASVPSSSAIEGASFVPLPDADSEGEMVAHAFHSAQILSAQEATASAVLARLPSAVVFHFAGHAFNSQQRSGLLLSDTLLSAGSLRSVSLSRMRLAVFSACDTQGGSNGGVYDSDSLVRVFLRAGVPEAVATRWNVDSAATRQFMDLFYRALLHGSNAADAIRQAQSSLRSQHGMEHPYYWSAFTGFGLI